MVIKALKLKPLPRAYIKVGKMYFCSTFNEAEFKFTRLFYGQGLALSEHFVSIDIVHSLRMQPHNSQIWDQAQMTRVKEYRNKCGLRIAPPGEILWLKGC